MIPSYTIVLVTSPASNFQHMRPHPHAHLTLRPYRPSPHPHILHPPPVLLEPSLQQALRLLPLLPILEAVEVIFNTPMSLPLLHFLCLGFCFFESSWARTPAARYGDEAVFVGDGARGFPEAVSRDFQAVELREVGVYGGLKGGGRGVEEGGVGFVSCSLQISDHAVQISWRLTFDA
jgi:hypothetical protein